MLTDIIDWLDTELKAATGLPDAVCYGYCPLLPYKMEGAAQAWPHRREGGTTLAAVPDSLHTVGWLHLDKQVRSLGNLESGYGNDVLEGLALDMELVAWARTDAVPQGWHATLMQLMPNEPPPAIRQGLGLRGISIRPASANGRSTQVYRQVWPGAGTPPLLHTHHVMLISYTIELLATQRCLRTCLTPDPDAPCT